MKGWEERNNNETFVHSLRLAWYDWQKAYDKLAAYGNTIFPIYALKEGEFIVKEQA